MNTWPSFNYWLYDEAGKFRHSLDHEHELSPGTGDLRSVEYRADLHVWSKRFFWTAEEAAALAFGRDPRLIGQDAELIAECVDDESQLLHSYIEGLIEEIKADKRMPDAFPPKMFFEWVDLKKVDFYPALREATTAHSKQFDELSTRQSLPSTDAPKIEEQLTSQQKRAYNTLLKIIWALLSERKESSKNLSTTLEEILEDAANRNGDRHLFVPARTIENKLDEARQLGLS